MTVNKFYTVSCNDPMSKTLTGCKKSRGVSNASTSTAVCGQNIAKQGWNERLPLPFLPFEGLEDEKLQTNWKTVLMGQK